MDNNRRRGSLGSQRCAVLPGEGSVLLPKTRSRGRSNNLRNLRSIDPGPSRIENRAHRPNDQFCSFRQLHQLCHGPQAAEPTLMVRIRYAKGPEVPIIKGQTKGFGIRLHLAMAGNFPRIPGVGLVHDRRLHAMRPRPSALRPLGVSVGRPRGVKPVPVPRDSERGRRVRL